MIVCRLWLYRISDTILFHRRSEKEQCKALTLVELMLVVAILATLVCITMPAYTHYIEKSRNSQAIAEVGEIALEITQFWAKNGSYPDTLAQVGCASHLDPWGNPYEYLPIEGRPKNEWWGKCRKNQFDKPITTDFDLYSMGKDGKTAKPLQSKPGSDDIIRAHDGAFIGLASEY
jgi:general secretion pathway protein G